MTAEPNVNLTADCNINVRLRDLVGGKVLSFSPHSCCRYFYFYFPSRARSRVSEILLIEPHASTPTRRWAVHRLPAAKPGWLKRLWHAILAADSGGGHQTFHLLCISFLAVPVLEATRHWSHLTETSLELFHLNYSLTMKAIPLKGRLCLCFPRGLIKSSV